MNEHDNTPASVTRLNVNINPETKAALEGWSQFDNTTITETIRRAIGVYAAIRTLDSLGSTIIAHDPETGLNTQLMIMDGNDPSNENNPS